MPKKPFYTRRPRSVGSAPWSQPPTPEQEAEMQASNWGLTGGALGTVAGGLLGGLPGAAISALGSLEGAPPEFEGEPVMMGQARWKRAGVPPEVIRGLSAPRDPLHQRIADRDVWYHATSPENVSKILGAGAIRPGSESMGGEFAALSKWAENIGEKLPQSTRGVSVSRAPRITSKADKAVTFAIDREKMPPSRPFTERGYGKTEANEQYFPDTDMTFAGGPNRPNPRFEFEQRTRNQPIPLSAVREALIDQSALPRFSGGGGGPFSPSEYGPTSLEQAQAIQAMLGDIPSRIIPSGRALHSDRAARAKPFYKRRSAGATE